MTGVLAAPFEPLMPAPAETVEVVATHLRAVAVEGVPPAHVLLRTQGAAARVARGAGDADADFARGAPCIRRTARLDAGG